MSFSVSEITYLVFSVFVIAVLGFAVGRITVKGVNLGTAGVFIIALLYGILFGDKLSGELVIGDTNYITQALKIIENIGLVLFVTSVGFIAGPNFFKNLKNNFKSYVLIGVSIILAGGATAVVCICVGRLIESGQAGFDPQELTAIITGLLSGALTSTPAFSAAKETVAAHYQDAVAVGYGIAYIFGVVGVVLFVQFVPKIDHADMAEERKKLTVIDTGETFRRKEGLIRLDPVGLAAISIAVAVGILAGSIKIFDFFSLTITGGTLLTALVVGHFGHVGPIDLMPEKHTLETCRELGLVLFLTGAGISGGMNFVKYFKAVYFIYGMAMTTIPMIAGYMLAKKCLKLGLLNNLGSITGGMTSTPALGTLINVAGTDDVVSAYAATYPVALIAVVLISQFLIILF